MKVDLNTIINGAFANVLAIIILSILGLVFLDNKRTLAPWIYWFFGNTFTKYLYFLIKIIIHPLLRIILFIIFLVWINYKEGDIFLSILLLSILLSFLLKPKFENKFLPAPVISDDFKDISKWTIKTGDPEKENGFGKPAPGLGLKINTSQATNSFVILNNIDEERGIIECDIYLELNSLLNIVFFADIKNEKWYMARYDSRGSYSDGFLIKD